MRKPIIRTFALFGGFVVIAVIGAILWNREPMHQGKSVSYWFYESFRSTEAMRQAREATSTMGKPAVRFLTRVLDRDESRLYQYYRTNWTKLPQWIQRRLHAPLPALQEQTRAADLLAAIGPAAEDAVPHLIAALERTVAKVPISTNVTAVSGSDAAELWRILGDRQQVSIGKTTLIRATKGSDGTLMRGPPGAAGSGTVLVVQPNHSTPGSESLRWTIVRALGAIGGEQKEIVPALLAALRDPDDLLPIRSQFRLELRSLSVRQSAAEALRNTNILRAVRQQVPLLRESLRATAPLVRGSAAGALGLVVADDDDIIADLLGTLGDASPDVRAQAASALRNARSHYAEIGQALIKLLLSEEPAPNIPAGPRLQMAPPILPSAESALQSLGRRSDDVIELLIAAAQHSEPRVRTSAARVLGGIGPNANAALPCLEGLSKDSDRSVRLAAAEALWRIGRLAHAIIPFRIEDLKAPSEQTRWNALVFLAELGSEAKPAVPAVIEALQDPSNRVRGRAAMTLGEIGTHAAEAIPALKKAAAEDEYSNARDAATEALRRIGYP